VQKVLLAPHLDDVALSCFGAVSARSVVVTVFAGVPSSTTSLSPWDRRCGATSARELVLRRIEEDRRAFRRTGVHLRYLPFLEHQYRDAPADVDELAAALRPELRDAGEVWVPAAICGHPDHHLVRSVTLPVLRELSPAAVWLYAEYPYHQYLRQMGPAGRGTAVPDTSTALDEWFAHRMPPGGRPALHRHLLPTPLIEEKQAALSCYQSQLDVLDATLDGRLLDEEMVGTEYCWRVRGSTGTGSCYGTSAKPFRIACALQTTGSP
jgi:LmbE family N-acetylglucosaminyl deacetylase